MKFFVKKIYLTLIISLFLSSIITFARSSTIESSQDTISNYFLGIISASQNSPNEAYNYFNKVKPLKDIHKNFNIQFIKTLISLEKFNEAFAFSKNIWSEDEFIFEADMLLGINSLINKDYSNSEKYFSRLKKASQNNFFYEDFLSNILIAWINASKNKEKESFNLLNEIPDRYENLKKIQNCFLQCYFDIDKTEISFKELISDKEYGFSRYSFFLVNYLLFKNNKTKAEKTIQENSKVYNSNLLIKQTENFILNGDTKKIKNYFNCKNPKDSIAEIFYVMANIHSTQKEYEISNFYFVPTDR